MVKENNTNTSTNTNTRLKIAFDIDFTMTTDDNYNKVFGELYPGFDVKKHYTHYPIEESLFRHGFIPSLPSQEGYASFIVYHNRTLEIFGKSSLEPWFLYVYNRIKDDPSIEIFFITARNPKFEHATHELFSQYNLPTSNLYHIGGYHKEELIREHGIHAIFEDNLATVKKIAEDVPHCHSFLVDRLYNQDSTLDPTRITRFSPNLEPSAVFSLVADKLKI